MKNVFYEEDGNFKVGSIMTATDASLQVEAPHGKRSKIKTAQVLLRFEGTAADFLPQAEALAAELDIDFLWSCCGSDEFSFDSLAQEYYGTQASAVQQAAVAIRLHGAPMYFYRKGRGRYKAAPEESLQAALAGIERKKREQQQIDQWLADLTQGQVPPNWLPHIPALLTKPDKNTLEYKALDQASQHLAESPLRLLAKRGGIPSVPQFLLSCFLLEHFPKGRGFPSYQAPTLQHELPQANVRAFSIDDAATTEIDDAFSLVKQDNGHYQVGIHIAAPALGISAQSDLEKIIQQRLSTVYFPGDKITMLPEEVVTHFTLKEGHYVPALSMYIDVSPEWEILGHHSVLEQVFIADNLRHDRLEVFFNEETVGQQQGEAYPYKEELNWLWQFANVLEQKRGKADPNRPPQVDYNFALEGERVIITRRKRGAPMDKLVSELMILVNSTWGGDLAQAGIGGLYRAQTNGKVKMTTSPLPHVGLGVEQYAWSSSPLRRAVDFVNQQQLIAMVTDTPPRFARNDASLFAVLRDFDAAYTAYGQFQSKMERYWCLRWLQQENITDTTATWLKEDLVRLENLPFTFRLTGLPSELTPGTRLRLQIISMDELEQQLECRYLGLCDVEPPIVAEEGV